ncbi:hypothetical protein hmeg3_18565 [Herbaspirillum sp. meg3]|uniref:T6SS immunity protein Tli3 family protein n=1 Tax=Herbaspirillum sp. meg3 TaxID=2025949 RepID=UPI000B993C3C|nr:hypothetical protein [Herbaspirillum sp. meg3]ASU40092.1 hypothetical protein hmeg3_18565 [Herbaspirillum sp. meg3]
MMKTLKMIGAALLAVGMTACAQNDAPPTSSHGTILRPSPDMPPQVLYRIDDHRYISLENYDKCFGDNYYIDTKAGIRTKLWTGAFSDYKGRLIIDDPSEMNVVVPDAPATTCRDKGCNVYLQYSTDGGRTFKPKKYMQSPYPTKDSENYSILIAKDGFYLVKKISQTNGSTSVTKYPLVPGIDLEKPYPPDLHDEYLSGKPLPLLRTPSGQDRFTCDSSIRPSNLPQPK